MPKAASTPSPCARCHRIRALVRAVLRQARAHPLVSALLCLMPVAALAAVLGAPTAPTTASVAIAPSASSAPSPVAAASSAPVQWIYRTVVLPAGRVGADYGPRAIAKGGSLPYAFSTEGRLPPGLALSPDGMLHGTPEAAGSYAFTLVLRDGSTPPVITQQPYVLRIDGPRPKAAASAPVAVMTAISIADAASAPDANRAWPLTYKLTAAMIEQVAGPPQDGTAAGDADKPAAPAPIDDAKAAGADALKALLTPLVDIEYPSRALFGLALEDARCNYYRSYVKALATRKGQQVDDECPSTPVLATATAASGAKAVTLPQFYAGLLSEATRNQLFELAATPHPLTDAKDIVWSGGGCGCTPKHPREEVDAFYPFWMAAGQPQVLNFSQLTRISYLGVVLDDAGGFSAPVHRDARPAAFVGEARRHGTAVDLVLYRRDWGSLLALSPRKLDSVAKAAAANAMEIVDGELDDSLALVRPLLAPFWREHAHAFDGITVFVEDVPTDAESARRFAAFFQVFMRGAIAEMQHRGRDLHLNVVVPDHLLGVEGSAYDFEDLLSYITLSEPKGRTRDFIDPSDDVGYSGTTEMTLKLLVLMGEPVERRLKDVRARIDQSRALNGHKRVAMLDAVVPVLVNRQGKPVSLDTPQTNSLKRRLAYMRWNYGGLALWPAPTEGVGTSADVAAQIEKGTDPHAVSSSGICRLVCPNRIWLRLAFEGLLLLGPLAIGAYLLDCRVRRWGRSYLLWLWAGGIVTMLVGAALLSCDTDLESWRESNYFLYALIAALFVAGIVATFRSREERP